MANEDNFKLIFYMKHTHDELSKRWNTKGGKSSRTCRATHINLEQTASELFRLHIEGFPSKDAVNFAQ